MSSASFPSSQTPKELFTVETSLKVVKQWLDGQWLGLAPELAVILGTGWNRVVAAAGVERVAELSYLEAFGAAAGVPGHEGQLLLLRVEGCLVLCMQGRFHVYEGFTAEAVTRPLQVLAQLGVRRLVVTAAVGALNDHDGPLQVGQVVLVKDAVTLFMPSPLSGGPRFQDLSQLFEAEWRAAVAARAHQALGLQLPEAVYAAVPGPHFETPADKRLLAQLGATVVGMSTVPEAIMAAHLGLATLGLACITNLAFGQHDHQQVTAAAEQQAEMLTRLLLLVMQPPPEEVVSSR